MPPPRVVLAGGTGLLGRALADALAAGGCDVVVLTRQPASVTASPAADASAHAGVRLAHWNPDGSAGAWSAFVDGARAVVNLAGESIGGGRWTAAFKARLRDSRFNATRSLLDALARCSAPPPAFVSASAVGYYGDGGDRLLTEESPPGHDFLASLCAEWEAIARRAAEYCERVVVVRSGLVLDRDSGALPRMVTPVKFFAGGPLGSGRQFISWIHVDDWVGLVGWAINERQAEGAINAMTPHPATNREFVQTIGAVLGRPTVLPAPAFALRVLLGEMADALLLYSQRAIPERALALGFKFRYPELRAALEAVLRKRN